MMSWFYCKNCDRTYYTLDFYLSTLAQSAGVSVGRSRDEHKTSRYDQEEQYQV